ncbi:hypothetical protein KR032_010266, partial [Drosophila birchii]
HFSCRLAVVVTVLLMCAGSSQGSDQFTAKARQMMHIYGDPSVSTATQQRNLDRLADFYQENRHRIQFTPQERQRADDLLRRYNQAKANTVYVDGVPAQGGGPVESVVIIGAAKEMVNVTIKHTASS